MGVNGLRFFFYQQHKTIIMDWSMTIILVVLNWSWWSLLENDEDV
jgi:hypothetical protein